MAKANKTQETDASVEEFIATLDEARQADCTELVTMMQAAAKAPGKMWGKAIIGFGDYHYKYESGREGDWFCIGFSPRKTDLTLYILPGFEDHAELMAQLGKHKTGKSCLYIKKLDDIDRKILKKLLQAAMKVTTKQAKA
ncbi:MAG: DUF1801 domain-containing protein [Fimbriiglobus sp.]